MPRAKKEHIYVCWACQVQISFVYHQRRLPVCTTCQRQIPKYKEVIRS